MKTTTAMLAITAMLFLAACGGGTDEDAPAVDTSPIGAIGFNGANCATPDWRNIPDCVPPVRLPEPAPRETPPSN